MSPTRPGKKELRLVVNEETANLLKRLAGVTDRSMSSLVQEAIEKLLSEQGYQDLIEYHRLDREEDESD